MDMVTTRGAMTRAACAVRRVRGAYGLRARCVRAGYAVHTRCPGYAWVRVHRAPAPGVSRLLCLEERLVVAGEARELVGQVDPGAWSDDELCAAARALCRDAQHFVRAAPLSPTEVQSGAERGEEPRDVGRQDRDDGRGAPAHGEGDYRASESHRPWPVQEFGVCRHGPEPEEGDPGGG